MPNQTYTDQKRIKVLQNQITDLKRLTKNLTEAAQRSRDKELSWVYAMEGNRDGVWDWNPITDEVFFSTRWKEMLGFKEDEVSNELSEWDKRIHPDDKTSVYADLNQHLEGKTLYYQNEHRVQCKDGSYKWILDRGKTMSWTDEGKPLRVVGTHSNITARKEAEIKNQRLLQELQEALDNVKVLSGLLPICSSCKNIRDDKGYWKQIESYIKDHSEVEFSHGICPACAATLYPEHVSEIYLDSDRVVGEDT